MIKLQILQIYGGNYEEGMRMVVGGKEKGRQFGEPSLLLGSE